MFISSFCDLSVEETKREAKTYLRVQLTDYREDSSHQASLVIGTATSSDSYYDKRELKLKYRTAFQTDTTF